jgi:hypothetical protein
MTVSEDIPTLIDIFPWSLSMLAPGSSAINGLCVEKRNCALLKKSIKDQYQNKMY